MSKVVEYEATKEQVIEFIADCDKAMESFDCSGTQAISDPEARELITRIREKWDNQRKSRGREMSAGGLYGALYEAILRLPRLNRPATWFEALSDARATAPYIKKGELC